MERKQNENIVVGHSAGQKVKTDPRGKHNPIEEPAGPVASDSLAAESVRHGGKFAENKDSAPLSVEGHKSTLGNTDTSSAKTLPPAENSEIREFKQHHGSKASQEKGQRHGQTHTQGHSSSGGSQGGSAKTASTQTPSAGGSKHVGIAPTYVEPVLGAGVDPKPKGKDLKEGGFDKDASQNPPGDNGSKMDPARLAEMRFEARAAETPVHAAVPGGGGEPGVSTKSEQPYGALEPEQEA